MADDTYIHAPALVHTHLTAASHLLHRLWLSKSWIKGSQPSGTCACVHLCVFACVCLKRHLLLLNRCQQRGLYLNERLMSGFVKRERRKTKTSHLSHWVWQEWEKVWGGRRERRKKIHHRKCGCVSYYHLKSGNECYCYDFINEAGDTLSFGLGNKSSIILIYTPTYTQTHIYALKRGDAERLGSFASPTKATKSVIVSFQVRRQWLASLWGCGEICLRVVPLACKHDSVYPQPRCTS